MTNKRETADGAQELAALIAGIEPLDENAMASARQRQAVLTKPPGSLGRLEDLSIQIAGITGHKRPVIHDKAVVVMAGDHGVVAAGVSAYPQSVTAAMVNNFLAGGAAINVLARQAEARVVVVDMGVATPLTDHSQLISRPVAAGTQNMATGPAMSKAQAVSALVTGAEVVTEECTRGLDIVGLGEMGIGNTTAAAAIATALTGYPPDAIVGRGTGVDDVGLARKRAVVTKALGTNRPDPADALDVLAKVGGFEIGGLAGAIMAAAAARIPVVVDGFIATAAAMLAVTLAPQAHPYLIAAHHSMEEGHGLMLEWLRLRPLLALDMRLGEGTGAVLGMSLADAACRILNEMATFDEAGVQGPAHGEDLPH